MIPTMRLLQDWLDKQISVFRLPTNVLRGVSFVIVVLALIDALFAPMLADTRLKLISVASFGLVYAIFIWTPYLPGKRTVADTYSFLPPITNAIFFGAIVYFFSKLTPVIPAIYLLSIVGTAMQHGIRSAVLNALLSAVSYLIVLGILGMHVEHGNDWIAFTITFLVIGLFTGSLATALRHRTYEFDNVLNHTHEAIMILNERGGFEYLNPSAVQLGGYALTELKDRTVFDIIVQSDHTEALRSWAALQTGKRTDSVFIIHIRRKDNAQRTLAVTFTPYGSTPGRYLAIARDMTAEEIDRQAHERRHHELDAERAVTQAISQIFNLHELLNIALTQTLNAIRADAGAIYLANTAQTDLTLTVSHNLPADFAALVAQHSFGEGITGAAATQRNIIIVPNLDADGRAEPRDTVARTMSSQVSVPLIYQERVVGVLSASNQSERTFSDDDLGLLRAIASSIAVAIDRAQLFETLEQRVADRTTELSALNRIAAAANQSLDLDRVLDATLDELVLAARAQGAWVSFLDPERGILWMRAQKGVPPSVTADPQPLRLGEGISGLAIKDGRAHTLNIEDSRIPARDHLLAEGMQSICAVPLIIQGRPVGVLGLLSNQRDHFDEAELRWLGAVGNTVAVALDNAQLFESVDRQVNQLATLREIDRTLNSELELAPMLEAALDAVARIVPYDCATVLLLEGIMLRAVAGRGIERTILERYVIDISNSTYFGKMVQKHKPVYLNDVRTSPGWITVTGMEEVRSWLGAPMIARERVIGQLSLYSFTTNAFNHTQSDLLLSFADHTAIAIANAQLRAELNNQARRDSMTQILNHGTLIDELKKAGAQAVLTHNPISLIMLDLDDFKNYNDTYGHVIGDQVLIAAAQAIRKHIKSTDLVGRWGGEEFSVALIGADTPHALRVAKRISTTLAETMVFDSNQTRIPPPTVSQGIATLGVTAHTVDELIDRADYALYLAKNRGKDQVAIAE